MKKRKWICAGALVLLLAGCGSGNDSYVMTESTADSYYNGAYGMYESAAAEEVYYDDYDAYDYDSAMQGLSEAKSVDMEASAPEAPESAQTSNRKLIRNVSMDVETKDFDALMEHLTQRTKELGGYVENSYTYNGSRYGSTEPRRNASLSIRIPSARLDEYLNDVAQSANIVNRSENVSDVTLSYVDLESHRNALRTEEERLLELMERAETIEDLITIENRLTDIRYQIESMESQLRSYDNQVDYATLNLSVQEVKELTPVVEQSALEKMGSGFLNSLSSIGRGLANFGIGLVMNLPYLILFALIVVVIVLILKAIIKKIIKKFKAKREPAAPAEQKAEEQKSVTDKEDSEA